jgi:hypothetical protein
MPFRSRAQAGYMFEHHPEIAKEFADKTPDMKMLPMKLQNAGKKPESPWLHMTINMHNHHPEAMTGKIKNG